MRSIFRAPTDVKSLKRLQRQMVDYVSGTMRLIAQRQAIYFSVTILAAAYFDFWLAMGCYSLVQAAELIDIYLARAILKLRRDTPSHRISRLYAALVCNTVSSGLAISFFVFVIARQEGNISHFTPMFFLFAAALFAAMNNHQLLPLLIIRLTIYTVTFLAIPIIDIFEVQAALASQHWLQLFTVVFVLCFVVDSSVIYIKLYRSNLDQLESLIEEKENATAALIAKSRFLSTISHELRTPLTSVGGAISLLGSGAMGELSDKQKHALGIAEKNIKNLTELVGDVLDVQSLEADELVLNMEVIDLANVLEAAVKRNDAKVIAAGKVLEVTHPQSAVLVMADRKRIDKILDGLVVNAIKFSYQKSTIKLGLLAGSTEASLTVTDEGAGIPAGQEDIVFSSFSQGDASDIRKAGGVGMGLFLAKSILEKMAGTINYNSIVDVGTTFTVTFKMLKKERISTATAV